MGKIRGVKFEFRNNKKNKNKRIMQKIFSFLSYAATHLKQVSVSSSLNPAASPTHSNQISASCFLYYTITIEL